MEPWEGSEVQNFLSRAEPLNNGRWRIWYTVRNRRGPFYIAVAEGIPGEPMRRTRIVTSEQDAPWSIEGLPDDWHPAQPVHLQLPNGRHRLYFWAYGPSVARYLAAESDDEQHYRIINAAEPCLYHPNDRAAVGVAEARALGLTPSIGRLPERPAHEPSARGELICNDATNVYQLADGSFELYSPGLIRVPRDDPRFIAHDNAAGLLRVIDRWVSADGLHWTGRRRVIEQDANDPQDQQFYYLAVTYTPQGRVGMLGHYRVQAQTMDLEWCFSADGLQWQRPLRIPWIRRGREGEPDSYAIYACSSLVQYADKWWLFYTGMNMAHNYRHSHGSPHSVIMLATTDSIWT